MVLDLPHAKKWLAWESTACLVSNTEKEEDRTDAVWIFW